MSYPSEILADSPIVYYRFGETSGTTMADSSGNGRNGVYEGSPGLGDTSLLVGDSNAALGVNGVGQRGRASATTHTALQSNYVTVSAVVKPTVINNGNQTVAARYDGGTGTAWILRLENGGSGRLWLWVRTASATWQNVASVSQLVVNTTYHVAGTFDGTTLAVYINGALNNSKTITTTTIASSTVDLYIGTEGANAERWIGAIDELAVFGTALSSTRISAQYTASITAPVAPTGTITAVLPALSANLSGGVTYSGTIAAALPPLGANLSGTSTIAGIAGDITATLPQLGASLAGAYSDTATLAAILPPLSASLAGNYGPSGTLAATLPGLTANLAGSAYEPGMDGTLNAVLPALSASLSGVVLGRTGLGLILDSSAVLTVDAALEPEPSVPAGTPPTVLHIIAPTVPIPTLVAGRPQ